jgi:Ala-tRNA(Pro) deacylase
MSEPGHATEKDLFDRLETLGIETKTLRHAPVFTVDEGRALWAQLPGGHCKSLFLKDKKAVLWLVVALADTAIDMKSLQSKISSARLSFGKPELMTEILGVVPGSVTPFALINPSSRGTRVILEQRMLEVSPVHYHPLTNEATTAITPEDLIKFITACGHTPEVLPL